MTTKRALVTGATGNVGRATAKLLLDQGWEVIGVARKESKDVPELTTIYQTDLAYPRFIHGFLEGEGDFDLVVMAHGTQQPAELGTHNFTQVYQQIRTNNLDSAVYLTDVLIDHNQLNPGSLIVYCSSIQATQPRTGRGPYAIAKAGLEALCKIAAVELADKRIRTVALRLGQLTETMKNITFTDEQRQAIEERTLLEWVDPGDVAKLILSLYDQKSMTGEIINLDSGHRLNIWP